MRNMPPDVWRQYILGHVIEPDADAAGEETCPCEGSGWCNACMQKNADEAKLTDDEMRRAFGPKHCVGMVTPSEPGDPPETVRVQLGGVAHETIASNTPDELDEMTANAIEDLKTHWRGVWPGWDGEDITISCEPGQPIRVTRSTGAASTTFKLYRDSDLTQPLSTPEETETMRRQDPTDKIHSLRASTDLSERLLELDQEKRNAKASKMIVKAERKLVKPSLGKRIKGKLWRLASYVAVGLVAYNADTLAPIVASWFG